MQNSTQIVTQAEDETIFWQLEISNGLKPVQNIIIQHQFVIRI